MDTDTNLDPRDQAVIHYEAVDQERTVVLYMDTHLVVEDIHKAAEEGKGMGKENNQALPLMEAIELAMKMKSPLLLII